MNYYISKRAGVLENALQLLYSPNMGLFENIFRLAPYIVPSLFKISLPGYIMSVIGARGLGLDKLIQSWGKELDQFLGTEANSLKTMAQRPSEINIDMDKIMDFVQSKLATATAANGSKQLQKNAAPITAIVRFLYTIISRALKGVLAFFGFATLDKLIRSIYRPIEMTKEMMGEMEKPISSRDVLPTTETKKDVDTMIDQLREKYNLRS